MPDQPAHELPDLLRDAHLIVDDQLVRLRDLAERARRERETLGSELRQMERHLDEVTLQHRSAIQWQAPQVQQLGERMSNLRAQCEMRAQGLAERQIAVRQLEQLIRQIEMSSDALNATGTGTGSDPWALALRAQVIHGREEERARLAREVHDGPAQVLANSLMLLESAFSLAQKTENERLTQVLDRLRQATREGLHEVRRFISDLRTVDLTNRGLIATMQEYIQNYNRAYQSTVDFHADPLPPLPGDAEIVLYRVMQESLQNVHKYARGAPVQVRLIALPGQVQLSIRDEGPGFDPHEVVRRAGRSNWGLTSMRERAELIGARFTVASRPGHGTEVLVQLVLE